MAQSRPISFITDYGLDDPSVGICHAVMRAVTPDAPILDLSHGVLPGVVEHGARMLADALRFLPVGVIVGVVDPGVGGPRRAVVIESESGHHFVGPDNGIFWPSLEIAGGARRAFDVGASAFAAREISPTFHGRDIFAPVAANLSFGEPLEHAGDEIDIESLQRLELSKATRNGSALQARVVDIDHFGNVRFDATRSQLDGSYEPGKRFTVRRGNNVLRASFALTFAEVEAGGALLFEDSSSSLALACNRANAAHKLGASFGDPVVIEPAASN